MKLDEQDRLVRPMESSGRPILSTALAIAVAGAAAFVALPELREYAKGLAFGAGDAIGINVLGDEYSAVYQRMGISPLPAKLLASSKISSGLAQLSREPCVKRAIFAFGEALVSAREERRAADAYVAFAASCPNGEGEQNRAAQILFRLGDSEHVI